MNSFHRRLNNLGLSALVISLAYISFNPGSINAFYDRARALGSDLKYQFFGEGRRPAQIREVPTTQPDYSKESTIITHDRDEGKLMVDNAWDLEKQLYLLGPKYRKEVKNC